jgi:hypothetical protein
LWKRSLPYDAKRKIDWVRYNGQVYRVAFQNGKKLSLRQAGFTKIVHYVYVHQVEIGGYKDEKKKKD